MTDNNRIEREGITYTHLEDDIHEFVFTGDSEKGLDEFFELLADLLKKTPSDATLRYIVDATKTKGRGSMNELVRRFRKLEAQFPMRAAGRTAILHDGSLLLTLANTFVDTLAPNKDRTHFFEKSKREAAIEWLKSTK